MSYAKKMLQLQQYRETREAVKKHLDDFYKDYADKLGPEQEELKNKLLATIQGIEEDPGT